MPRTAMGRGSLQRGRGIIAPGWASGSARTGGASLRFKEAGALSPRDDGRGRGDVDHPRRASKRPGHYRPGMGGSRRPPRSPSASFKEAGALSPRDGRRVRQGDREPRASKRPGHYRPGMVVGTLSVIYKWLTLQRGRGIIAPGCRRSPHARQRRQGLQRGRGIIAPGWVAAVGHRQIHLDASKRPGHYRPGMPGDDDVRPGLRLASKRPGHYRPGMSPAGPRGYRAHPRFKEAGALSPRDDVLLLFSRVHPADASKRPGHYRPGMPELRDAAVGLGLASKRPGHYRPGMLEDMRVKTGRPPLQRGRGIIAPGCAAVGRGSAS